MEMVLPPGDNCPVRRRFFSDGRIIMSAAAAL